jgi:hypothetical protein
MTRSPHIFNTTGLFIALAVAPCVAQAQLFGNRNTGTAPGAQMRSPFGNGGQLGLGTGPTLGSAADELVAPGGVLDGNERFIRGNRSRQDFVGNARSNLSGFVGAGQAIGVGRVPAATDSFRLQTLNSARINQPLPSQPARGMYYPKLELDLGPNTSAATPRSDASSSLEIQRRVQNVGGENVLVLVAGDTAILKGRVESQRMAELIINVLSFEPGIDRVDNQLTVQ